MRSILICAAFVGCATPAPDTLWYVDPSTRNLMLLNVGDSSVKEVDSGKNFDNVTIDPQSKQVAYVDGMRLFVADLHGAVLELLPNGGQVNPAPTWQPSGWLSYPLANNGALDIAIAHPPDLARALGQAGPIAFSSDGAYVAYLASSDHSQLAYQGDLTVEQTEGGLARVVAPSIALRGFVFSPDNQAILGTMPGNQLVEISLNDGSVMSLGTGGVFAGSDPSAINPYELSYDGDHVLVGDENGIFVLGLSELTRRNVAATPSNLYRTAGVFTPSGDLLYAIQVLVSSGPPEELTGTVFIDDGSASTTLVSGDGDGPCLPVAVSPHVRYVAIECADAVTITSISSLNAVTYTDFTSVLGFTEDDDSVLIEKPDGTIVRAAASHMSLSSLVATVPGATAAFSP